MSYNHDDSNGMMDYYDRGFYDHYEVGKWNKPYMKTEDKESAPVKKAEPVPAKKPKPRQNPQRPRPDRSGSWTIPKRLSPSLETRSRSRTFCGSSAADSIPA